MLSNPCVATSADHTYCCASSELLKIEDPTDTPLTEPAVVSLGQAQSSGLSVWTEPSRLVLQQNGGGERDRTDDPLLAKQVLSQLSYTPVVRLVPSLSDVVAVLAHRLITP